MCFPHSPAVVVVRGAGSSAPAASPEEPTQRAAGKSAHAAEHEQHEAWAHSQVSLCVCVCVCGGGGSSPKFVAYDTLTLSQTRQSRSHVDDLRGHQIGKESCEVTSLGWWGPLWANTFLTRTPFFLR